ncbi:hypothetical protein ACJW30_11G005100 [Castanea mollissima]
MVQDYVADLPLEAHVVPDDVADAPQEAHVVEDHAANLPQGNQNVLLDSSINWDLPPRYDATPDESDDADEMVQDYVADLPLEAHVVPDDVADAPQEAHVVPDDVANVPREAHVVEDHVANSQRLCPICDNAIGVAFCCGHQFCVECGDRYSTCPVCRDRVHIRFRVF